MNPNNFTEADKEKFVQFLNFIANKAEMTVNVKESIEFFKLLTHMQQVLLPKINDHIAEIKRIIEAEKEEEIEGNE